MTMEHTWLSKAIGYTFLFVLVYGFLLLVACRLGRLIGGPRRKVERQLGIDEEER